MAEFSAIRRSVVGRLVLLFLIMAGVAVAAAGISIWVLYQAALKQETARLAEIAQSQARLIEAVNCIGHGRCLTGCPVEAISLVFGTAKRGVDIPHVSEHFETNVPGLYIAGELGGMGLIRNAVTQGAQAAGHIARSGMRGRDGVLDLLVVGAGPAGLSASLQAMQDKLTAAVNPDGPDGDDASHS